MIEKALDNNSENRTKTYSSEKCPRKTSRSGFCLSMCIKSHAHVHRQASTVCTSISFISNTDILHLKYEVYPLQLGRLTLSSHSWLSLFIMVSCVVATDDIVHVSCTIAIIIVIIIIALHVRYFGGDGKWKWKYSILVIWVAASTWRGYNSVLLHLLHAVGGVRNKQRVRVVAVRQRDLGMKWGWSVALYVSLQYTNGVYNVPAGRRSLLQCVCVCCVYVIYAGALISLYSRNKVTPSQNNPRGMLC